MQSPKESMFSASVPNHENSHGLPYSVWRWERGSISPPIMDQAEEYCDGIRDVKGRCEHSETKVPGNSYKRGKGMVLVHDSDLRTNPPSPERGSLHSVAVWHPKKGHRVEDPARELHLDSLAR